MGIILFIISVILAVIFLPIGFAYSVIKLWFSVRFITWWRRINQYIRTMAVSIDQLGNVIMQDFFNDLLITKEGYKFGFEDETISSCIGKNKELNTLTFLGNILDKILNKLDPGHSIRAIEK